MPKTAVSPNFKVHQSGLLSKAKMTNTAATKLPKKKTSPRKLLNIC